MELYLEASLPDEAARVLLLRADGEPVIHRRVMFCDVAARTAADEGLKKKAASMRSTRARSPGPP